MSYIIKMLNIMLVFTSIVINAQANEFVGTWELVSGEYIDHEGKLISYQTKQLQSIKTISKSHFSFVSMAGDKFWSSGTGTYRITDKHYIETPIYTSYAVEAGQQYVFNFEMKGDYWYSSRFENELRVEYEVWRKIQ